MADFTDSHGFYKGTAAFLSNYTHRVSVIEVDLDFAKIAAARVAAGAAALAATDTLEVLPVPANCLVLAVGVQVTKAEGATATMDVGDSGSATRFVSNANLNATGSVASALTSPHLYTAASQIRITLDHNSIDNAVARVWAVVVDVN
jgi:hypothetical protein